MQNEFPALLLIVGGIVAFAVLMKTIIEKLTLPSMIVFLLLGSLLNFADIHWSFLGQAGQTVFEFMAKLGIFCLLFRVGLESNLPELIKKLRLSSLIWCSDVLVSGTIGFIAGYYILDCGLIPSLFIATALTATSVGIPVTIWQRANALRTNEGEIFLDVAELDDISGIVLMAMLFSVIPILKGSVNIEVIPILAKTLVWVLFKLLVFVVLCLIFSRYFEKRFTRFISKVEPAPDPMITLVGLALIIAALAGLIGFSVAIGSFLAGLVFSRDPEAVKMESSFNSLYELFVPFFFIGIGMMINPGSLFSSLTIAGVLLLAAIVGKVVGAGGAAWLTNDRQTGVHIGVSMIPRAEIAMVIMMHGNSFGTWAVPNSVFSAMVMVSAITCLIPPIILGRLLKTQPPTK